MSKDLMMRSTTDMQAERLTAIENRIHDNLDRMADAVIDIGRCLNQAKDEKLVPHGQWEAWVQEHAQMTPRVAQRAMRAAREIPSTSPLAALEFSKVVELMSLPPAEREQFAEEIGASDKSVRELREAIKAKEDAERTVTVEREQRQLAVEEAYRAGAASAQDELRYLQGQVVEREDKLSAAAREIAQMRGELEDQEDELRRRAASEDTAKRELLALRSQVARGAALGSASDTLTPDELASAAQTFMGRASILPHMRAQLAAADPSTRDAYRQTIAMLGEWCARAMNAINTISAEVVEP